MSLAISPACLEAFPEPLILVTGKGVLIAANRPGEDILGLPRKGKKRVSLLDVTDLSAADANRLLYECLATSAPIPLRITFRPLAGEPRSIRCEGWRCLSGGDAAVLIRIRSDAQTTSRFSELTRLVDELNNECLARRQSENRLRTALDQLQGINSIRDHMLSQVSHDLRTPLNAILGMTEFMRSEPYGALGEKYAEYVDDINLSGKALLELVDEVLHLTSGEVGQRDRTTEALADLSECLENCRQVVEPIARMRGLEIMIPADIALPKLKADQLLLKQILMNLMGNAAKHSVRGGRIEVSVEWREGKSLAILVKDSGPGIPAAKLASIRNDDLGTSAFVVDKGKSGYGLVLSRRSAKAIGAELDIQSSLGSGTVASLVLPPELVEVGAPAD